MSGRYTFFIAKKVSKISLSICSVGVFGPSYKRKEALYTYYELETDTQSVFNVPHIFTEDAIPNAL